MWVDGGSKCIACTMTVSNFLSHPSWTKNCSQRPLPIPGFFYLILKFPIGGIKHLFEEAEKVSWQVIHILVFRIIKNYMAENYPNIWSNISWWQAYFSSKLGFPLPKSISCLTILWRSWSSNPTTSIDFSLFFKKKHPPEFVLHQFRQDLTTPPHHTRHKFVH